MPPSEITVMSPLLTSAESMNAAFTLLVSTVSSSLVPIEVSGCSAMLLRTSFTPLMSFAIFSAQFFSLSVLTKPLSCTIPW